RRAYPTATTRPRSENSATRTSPARSVRESTRSIGSSPSCTSRVGNGLGCPHIRRLAQILRGGGLLGRRLLLARRLLARRLGGGSRLVTGSGCPRGGLLSTTPVPLC